MKMELGDDISSVEFTAVMNEAMTQARVEAQEYFEKELGGRDQYACGFAWVELHEFRGKPIKGNTRVGKALARAGLTQNHYRRFYIWNPAKMGVQNVDTLLAGAKGAAKVFKQYGFDAVACSRLD